MNSHEVDYKIYGDDLQAVEVELDPQETIVAEAGGMNWMEEDIVFEARLGDGSKPNSGFFGKILGIGKRLLTGESIFLTHFTNQGVGKRCVAFASPYPGKILPLDLSKVGGSVICQKDAFLCAAKGTEITITLTKKLGAGFFGGEGFILQKLIGDGMAFLHAGGTIVEKQLNGDKLRVDTGCIVGFTGNIDYSIERAGGLKSMLFGGEGLFLATLQGTGTVYLQTLPFSRLADRILRSAPSQGGKSKGEGSVLGSLGRMVDGDNF
ncbi:MAG: TIGR00266 family protein [Flavobacteriales bacterium]